MMSRQCEFCGKKPEVGHNVSHSHRKTKTRWLPNLSFKRLLINGLLMRVRICTSCLKTYTKKAFL